MKLYTEEQVTESYRRGLMDGRLNNIDYSISDGFKPIEFLSDEYFNKNLNNKTNNNMEEIIKVQKEYQSLSDEKRTNLLDTLEKWIESERIDRGYVSDNDVSFNNKPHISILEPGSEAAILFEASKPLMKLLNDNYHPHCTIIVNHGNVQVYEGICTTGFTNEFMND